ncbi:MAG: trypsin-like peptidase domain-containing protein [Dehalococcoidales bacterium]|nr:MAG: trypsin-like peptidase domain-containing protein [Dehalococcoidales bacterium]
MRRFGYFTVSLLLLISLVFGTGCSLIASEVAEEESPAVVNTTNSEPKEVVIPTSSQSVILPGIADVVALVKPSVVAINTEITITDFFSRESTQEAAGSGWIISEDGYIVTNNHVVADAQSITIILDDGQVYDAEIIGTDPLTDLAVIKIEAENLPAAQVGDSSRLRIGDWVVAIGNSLGLGIRATQGIVSRMDVSLQVDASQVLYGLIETDAAINPGNSGGPLVNLAGEVIGINSVKQVQVEVEGVGYAISTEEAVPIIEQLINYGEASHPYLGVSLYPVDQYVISNFGLTIDHGVFVVTVGANSPAAKAGLQPQDVILSFNGKEVETMDDLVIGIRSAEIGEEVEIVYWRDDEEKTTTATLVKRPNTP